MSKFFVKTEQINNNDIVIIGDDVAITKTHAIDGEGALVEGVPDRGRPIYFI